MSKRILLFSTFDWGGAGESTLRITKALRELGHEAILVVKQKTKNEHFIIQAQEGLYQEKSFAARIWHKGYDKINRKLIQLVRGQHNSAAFETDPNFYFGTKDESLEFVNIKELIKHLPFKPDLILIGWSTYFINTYNMYELSSATQVPVYWITTDMAPLTGGCHYAWDCNGYMLDCINCPAILSESKKQVAKYNLSLKLNSIKKGNIKVLAGSEWCRVQAKKSTLFRHQEVIPVLNGVVDQGVFNSRCRNIAKQVFGVNATDKLIFTGATFTNEKRKGIEYLVESLKKLYNKLGASEKASIKILVAGSQVFENKLVQQIPFDIVPFEFIKDDRLLSLAYQAADLFVCSSIEDSGPMMVNEALACGTPVVGFDLGFVSDIVVHGKNGFRVPLKNTDIMAMYMDKVLKLPQSEAANFARYAVKVIDEKVSIHNLGKLINELVA